MESENQKPSVKKPRGTAAMSPETRREVARKGGLKVSQDRAHMQALGKKGGRAILAKAGAEHFSKLGSLGGSVARDHRRCKVCRKLVHKSLVRFVTVNACQRQACQECAAKA